MKAFSEDQFEPIEWINKVLDSQTEGEDREQKASEVVGKLQLFIQEINRSLEESAQHVLLSMSKVEREVKSIDDRAQKMRTQLTEVRRQVDQVQACNSSPAIDRLSCLERLRTRMINESERLKEADNWHSLNGEVEQAITAGQLQPVYEKLLAMQANLRASSLQSQQNDYSERYDRLDQLKLQFESLLASYVSNSLLADDSADLIVYVNMYRELQMQDALILLFRKCLAETLANEWHKLKSTDLTANPLNVVDRFLEHIFEIAQKQANGVWTHLYSADASKKQVIVILIDSLSQAFANIESDITLLLAKQLDAQQDSCEKMKLLNAIRSIFDRFLISLESVLPDKSMIEFLHQVRPTFFAPCRKMFGHFERIDQVLLGHACEQIVAHLQLTELVGRCMAAVNDSINRCRQLSHLLLLPKTLPNTIDFLANCLRHLNACLFKITEQTHARQSSANWSLLQLSLLYLQTIGDFSLQINQFGQQLKRSLAQLESDLQSSSSPAALDLCLLNDNDREELNWLLEQKSDDGLLLKQIPDLCRQICADSGQTVFRVATAFANTQFEEMAGHFRQIGSSLPASSADMPMFSFSPQEYITQIGQYLLTVPQHIEPFTLQENAALRYAFQQAYDNDPTENVTEFLLRRLVENVSDGYIEQVARLNLTGKHDRLQLATDIAYFCEIISDLGIHQDERLANLIVTLKDADH